MLRPEKVQIVEDMTAQFKEAGSVFVADFAGLKVSDMTDLRQQLRQAGVKFRVVKNTLLRRAADDAGLSELIPYFKGPTAVALASDDPIPVAKVLHEFAVRLERPKVRAFLVERKYYGPEDLRALASLPSREIILSQLVSAVEGPIVGFIQTLEGVIRDFVGTIDALAKQRTETESE